MNEEEIKTKIVLPFLERLGFKASEMELETGFSTHVGRHVLGMRTAKKTRSNRVGARLDILVKRNGQNLFVVETKESDRQLTDEDRDQAVSYARLVHPVAPYAVVTNGTVWKLFDSITKQELEGATLQTQGDYRVALPEELKDEALRFFLGYSSENLQLFCEEQVSNALSPLRGSPHDLEKKFIPELHVPDKNLSDNLDKFVSSEEPGFLIAGESGTGKTCEMCFHVLRLLHQEPNTLEVLLTAA